MTRLEQAMQQAEARKQAGAGHGRQGIVFADSELQDRAIFSGFDIEFDELIGTSQAVADMYCQAARAVGLYSLFISSWCDGLLTGLLLASLPPATPETGVKDDTGSGE